MILFCWQARNSIGEMADGSLSPARRAEVEAHLVACPRCRERVRSQAAVRDALREAADLSAIARGHAADRWNDAALFEQRVMLAARARRSAADAVRPASGLSLRYSFPSPLPAAAALAMLVAAGMVAVGLPGDGSPHAPSTRASSGAPLVATDRVAPAPEIPFTLRQDLVGARQGTIPETTYVLEPAPWDGAASRSARIVRASL